MTEAATSGASLLWAGCDRLSGRVRPCALLLYYTCATRCTLCSCCSCRVALLLFARSRFSFPPSLSSGLTLFNQISCVSRAFSQAL